MADAAAAQPASAQPGFTTQPKSGNPSAAPSVAEPSPSSLSKGKSGQGSNHQPKPPATNSKKKNTVHVTRSNCFDSPFVFESSHRFWSSITRAPAPLLAPASSDGSRRRSWPMLGPESRQFDVTLGGSRRKGRKRCPRRMLPLARGGRVGVGRRTTHGRGVGLLQTSRTDVLSVPTDLQRESKQPQPPPSQQGPQTDDGSMPSGELSRSPPRVAAMGDKAEEGTKAETREADS